MIAIKGTIPISNPPSFDKDSLNGLATNACIMLVITLIPRMNGNAIALRIFLMAGILMVVCYM
jgi:hypothetical protein